MINRITKPERKKKFRNSVSRSKEAKGGIGSVDCHPEKERGGGVAPLGWGTVPDSEFVINLIRKEFRRNSRA
jgi:hypothetical protein